jgi:hypothetical protein
MATEEGVVQAWGAAIRHPQVAPALRQIVREVGDSPETRRNLLLAYYFCENIRTAAIESVGRSVLTADELAAHRRATGVVRRHSLALGLFAREPRHLLAIDIWNRWHGTRTAASTLVEPIPGAKDFAGSAWHKAAEQALEYLQGDKSAQTQTLERCEVLIGPDGDVLLGFREWPRQRAVRTPSNEVVSGNVPDWLILRFHQGLERLDVTDGIPDRGMRLANAILSNLVAGAPLYELLVQVLDDKRLDRFLARLTDVGDDTFPLVELVAQATWCPDRPILTLTAPSDGRVEPLVCDQRRLGAFALDWRTVKSAKVLFEGRYRISIHFPPAGEPQALAYSDVDRDKKVTERFAKQLKAELRVDVAPKARRGSARRQDRPVPAPKARSTAWWGRVLQPLHDAPQDWLGEALDALADLGLVSLTRRRLLHCGSAYLDRRAVGVDSLDCDGDVELPEEAPDSEDPTELEDSGEVVCSRGLHRWRPVRYGLPVVKRVRVEFHHDRLWEHLLEELAYFGEVEEEADRPGVATVRVAGRRAWFVYAPLVAGEADLLGATFGSTPVLWVRLPWGPQPENSARTVLLADFLGNSDCVGGLWDLPVRRFREPRKRRIAEDVVALESAGPLDSGGVIDLRSDGVYLNGKWFAPAQHSAMRLFDILRHAASNDDADDDDRLYYSPEQLAEMDNDRQTVEPTAVAEALPSGERGRGIARQTFTQSEFQTWVSRARRALAKAFSTEVGLGHRVIQTEDGRYRLGVKFTCRGRAVTAADDE